MMRGPAAGRRGVSNAKTAKSAKKGEGRQRSQRGKQVESALGLRSHAGDPGDPIVMSPG